MNRNIQISTGLFILVIAVLLIPAFASGQGVLITEDKAKDASPDNSAIFDLRSSDKGILVPRMTTIERLAILAPADGLLVYDEELSHFFYYDSNKKDGTGAWVKAVSGDASIKQGEAGRFAFWENSNTLSPYGLIEVSDPEILGDDDPIFLIRNKDGQKIFAVFQTGVEIFVDATPGGPEKSARGTFAVGGFTTQKDETFDYFRVTPDLVRININSDETKSARGTFAVGGFTTQKEDFDFLRITPESTNIFIDDRQRPDKSARGTFAVGGFTTQKDKNQTPFFNIEADIIPITVASEPRILYYPLKEAFLSGRILIESPDSVGTNSWASGFESKSIGDYSQALGYKSIARGNNSTAIGSNAVADADGSYAFGSYAMASGSNSFAFGGGMTLFGQIFRTHAEGSNSFAAGIFATAQGASATALGIATLAVGNFSSAIGSGTTASSRSEMALGTYNIEIAGNDEDWVNTDPLFVIGNGTSPNDRSNALTILKNGNVGIGTTNPSHKMHLRTEADEGALRIQIGGDTRFMVNANESVVVGTYSLTGPARGLYVFGDTGIGINNPSTILHVNHPNNASNGLSLSNSSTSDRWHFYVRSSDRNLRFYFNGNARGNFDSTSGTYTALSDKSLKSNISNTKNMLSKIMELNVVEYSFVDDINSKIFIGLIAQDVKEIFPEIVTVPVIEDKDPRYFIDYSITGVIAIKALQEQQELIEEQNTVIDKQRKEIEELKNRLIIIEELIGQ